VIGLYFDAQTAKANREAKEKNETVAKQTLNAAQKREAHGAGEQSDTLQAKTSLARAELEHTRAIGSHEKSLVALVVALGLQAKNEQIQDISVHGQELGRGIVLAPDYQDDDITLQRELKEWLSLAQEQHPAVVAARAQLESTKEKLVATRSEGLPTLDFTQSEYINGRPNQALTQKKSTESVAGLTLNVPLFDGFGRTYKVRGAQAQVEVKEAELRDTQNQVLGDVARTHVDAVAALRSVQSSQRLLRAAKEALEAVQRKYDRGIAGIIEMLNVQSALADAGQERIRALSEWRSARLRLLANTGVVGLKDIQKN
jgi:outer membrane protein